MATYGGTGELDRRAALYEIEVILQDEEIIPSDAPQKFDLKDQEV